MALSFAVQGANISVGITPSEVVTELNRALLYRKFSKRDPKLQGHIGDQIQFTVKWEPAGLLGGVSDIQNIPGRDPTIAIRTIDPFTYGEWREWTTESIRRGQVAIETELKEGLIHTVGRDINGQWGAQMMLTNWRYYPTGAVGAEAYVNNFAAGGAATATRNPTVWDLAALKTWAQRVGIPRHPKFGWNFALSNTAQEFFLRSLQAAVAAAPPKGWQRVEELWPPGTYLGALHGVNLWSDDSGDVLGDAVAGAAAFVGGEGLFFGRNCLVECSTNSGIRTEYEFRDGKRKIRFYCYEETIGCTLAVNTAGVGAVPPATRSSLAVIRVTC